MKQQQQPMIQKLGRKKEGLLPQEMETSIEQQVASTIRNQAAPPLLSPLPLPPPLPLPLCLNPRFIDDLHRMSTVNMSPNCFCFLYRIFLRKYKILADFSICFSSSFSPLNLSLVSDLQFLEYFTKSCITLDLFQHALTHPVIDTFIYPIISRVCGRFVS